MDGSSDVAMVMTMTNNTTVTIAISLIDDIKYSNRLLIPICSTEEEMENRKRQKRKRDR